MQEIDLSENREEREEPENMPDGGKPVKRNRKASKKKDGTVDVEGIAFERASNTFREWQKKVGAEEKASKSTRKVVKTLERKPRRNDRSFTESDKPVRSRERRSGRNDRAFTDSGKPAKPRERRSGRDDRAFSDGDKPVKSRLRSTGISGKREKNSEADGKDFKGTKRFTKGRDRTVKRAERSDSREGSKKVVKLSSDKGERFSKGSDRSRKGSAPTSKPADRKAKPPGSYKPGSKARGKKGPVIVYGDPKVKPSKKPNRRSIPKGTSK